MSRHILLYSVALLWLVTAYLRAEDRIRMVGPSAGEEAAKDLMEAVATSCNEMNYQEFMTHFTPKRAASIRKTMKHVFAQHDIEMEIHDVSLLSESEDRIVFALQYGWRDKRASPQVLYSEVVAVQTHNGWKIDSEKLKRSEVKRLPQQQFDLGGGGHVALSDDDAFWLPRDIVKRPGGCVGGRCGVGR